MFDPYSGVTSNVVESMHIVIKRLTDDWLKVVGDRNQRRSGQLLLLSTYKLTISYLIILYFIFP